MQFCNNFFSGEEFEYVHNNMVSILTDRHSMYKTSLTLWDKSVTIQNGATVLIQDPSPDIRNLIVEKIEQNFQKQDILKSKRLQIYYHFWMPESGLNWHNDDKMDSCTIYMNKEWDTHDNGFFVYYDENNFVKAIPPTPNTAMYMEENFMHSVATTKSDSPVRMTIQIFIER